MKKGKSLEKLVEHIERIIANKKDIIIEAPKKLIDRTTGKKREHDIVITYKGHRELLVAIECRDRSRPITVNQIESFWAKCQDTGVNKGVIVAPKGFWKTAITKADHYNIQCMNIEQALSFNWLLASELELKELKIKVVAFTLVPERKIKTGIDDFKIINQNGDEITKNVLIETVRRFFHKQHQLKENLIGKKTFKVMFPADSLSIKDHISGDILALKTIIAEVECEIIFQSFPFELIKYTEKTKDGKEIADIAQASVSFSGISGKIMIVQKKEKKNDGMEILFVSDRKE